MVESTRCPNCTSPVLPGQAFCPNCGVSLAGVFGTLVMLLGGLRPEPAPEPAARPRWRRIPSRIPVTTAAPRRD